MTVRTSPNGQIQPRNGATQTAAIVPAQGGGIESLMAKFVPGMAQVLPKHITPDRMARLALSALRNTRRLADCDKSSFFGSLLQAAQLGLEPNTPLQQAWLLPYGRECKLVIGYQGMLDLLRRTGEVSNLQAHIVREGDVFEREMGLEPKLRHVPSDDPDREDRPMTHVYCVVAFKDGSTQREVMSRGQVDAIRKRSRSSGNGPWATDYGEMAKKTVIRRMCKLAPRSIERADTLARAIQIDEAHERDAERSYAEGLGEVAAGMVQGLESQEQEPKSNPVATSEAVAQ